MTRIAHGFLFLILPACGVYTMENECRAQPDEGREIDGDLVAVESLHSAKALPPLEFEETIESEDGTPRASKRATDAFEYDAEAIVVPFGGASFRLRTPPASGSYRLEALGATLCEISRRKECSEPHGTVDVVVVEVDALDVTIRVDDEPIGDAPALRGSARLLFRRWEKQVCHARRNGSESAFAVRY